MERSVLRFKVVPPVYKVAFGRNQWLCLYKRPHRPGGTYYQVMVTLPKLRLELHFP